MIEKLRIILPARSSYSALLVGILISVQSAAPANALTWNLLDATFADGTTATGSFDYDAVTGAYSNISITTPAFSLDFPGVTYTSANLSSSQTLLSASFLPNALDLLLFFATALSNAPGTVSLLTGMGLSGEINNNTGADRFFASGSVTSVNPVPLPPAIFLMGTALIGMAGFNRLKRRRATDECNSYA